MVHPLLQWFHWKQVITWAGSLCTRLTLLFWRCFWCVLILCLPCCHSNNKWLKITRRLLLSSVDYEVRTTWDKRAQKNLPVILFLKRGLHLLHCATKISVNTLKLISSSFPAHVAYLTSCQRISVCVCSFKENFVHFCVKTEGNCCGRDGSAVLQPSLKIGYGSIKLSYLNTSRPLPVVPPCDSFSPICSLEIGLLNFHKREPSCYEEILMDLQQVINIKLQCFSTALLSWDVNRINDVENLCSVSCEMLWKKHQNVCFLSNFSDDLALLWQCKLIMIAHTHTAYWQITRAGLVLNQTKFFINLQ